MALPTRFVNAARLRATCKIVIGGQDVTAKFDPHLLDVSIMQRESGSGEAHIKLDDRYGRLRLPQDNDPIYIELGWPNLGSFRTFDGKLSDLVSSGQKRSGRTLILECFAADMYQSGKAQLRMHWGEGEGGQKVTLGKILEEAAKNAGVKLSISPDAAKIEHDYVAAMNESFMAFANRLAKENGLILNIEGGNASITKGDDFKNAKGQDMPSIAANVGRNVLAWRIKPKAGRPQWASVGHMHFDPAKAAWAIKSKAVPGGEGFGKATAVYTAAEASGSESRAAGEAGASVVSSVKNRGKGWVVIDGEPQAQPGGKMILRGARGGVDGEYRIVEVEHTYHRGGGFTTRLEVNSPQLINTGRGEWENSK